MELARLLISAGGIRALVAKVAGGDHAPGPDGVKCRQFVGYWQQHGDGILAALADGTYEPGAVWGHDLWGPEETDPVQVTYHQNLHARLVSKLLLPIIYDAYGPQLASNVIGFWRGQNQVTRARAAASFVKALGRRGYVCSISFAPLLESELSHGWLLEKLGDRLPAKIVTLIGRFLAAPVEEHGSFETGIRRGETLSPALVNVAMLNLVDPSAVATRQPWVRFQSDLHIGFEREEMAEAFCRSVVEVGSFYQEWPTMAPARNWLDIAPRLLHINTYRFWKCRAKLRLKPASLRGSRAYSRLCVG